MTNPYQKPYDEGYVDGLRCAWDAVDALVRQYSEIPDVFHVREQRNGMVLACNGIMQLIRLADDSSEVQK